MYRYFQCQLWYNVNSHITIKKLCNGIKSEAWLRYGSFMECAGVCGVTEVSINIYVIIDRKMSIDTDAHNTFFSYYFIFYLSKFSVYRIFYLLLWKWLQLFYQLKHVPHFVYTAIWHNFTTIISLSAPKNSQYTFLPLYFIKMTIVALHMENHKWWRILRTGARYTGWV